MRIPVDLSKKRPPRIAVAMFLLAAVLVGGILLVTYESGTETAAQGGADKASSAVPTATASAKPAVSPIEEIAESGRLQFYVLADVATLDENGKIDGGYAAHQTCEADAVVKMSEGRISEVVKAGTAESSISISTGEIVAGSGSGDLLNTVYRDDNGDIRLGCDPDSWTVLGVE